MKKILLLSGLLLFSLVAFASGTTTAYVQQLGENMAKAITNGISKLQAQQFASVMAITRAFSEYGDGDIRKLAWLLGCCWHESRLRPIKEIKAAPGSYVWENYQIKYWPSGYYGRGFVQLTHDYNYEKMGKILGIDLLNNPDLALDTEIAAKIAVIGTMEGIFTGKKLSQYFNDTKEDPYNARRTVGAINVAGTDTAALIQGYYNSISANYEG